jgi:hypothetical protein
VLISACSKRQAKPGQVIDRRCGTTAEQIAVRAPAAQTDRTGGAGAGACPCEGAPRIKPKSVTKPPPVSALDEAKRELAEERRVIGQRPRRSPSKKATLARRRWELEREWLTETTRFERPRERDKVENYKEEMAGVSRRGMRRRCPLASRSCASHM